MVWSHRHHASHAEVLEIHETRCLCPDRLEIIATLGVLARDVHLHQYVDDPIRRGAERIHGVPERGTIERMKKMKASEMLHFVPLQVANQVPAKRQGEGVHLFQRLLNPIFTDVPKARVPCGLQRIRSMGFGHRDNRDRLAVPAAPYRCVDPLSNLPNPVRQVEKRHKAASYR